MQGTILVAVSCLLIVSTAYEQQNWHECIRFCSQALKVGADNEEAFLLRAKVGSVNYITYGL